LKPQRILVLCFLLGVVSASCATDTPDAWRSLLKAVRFAELSHLVLDRDCRTHPTFSSRPNLVALCKKRDRIPDSVFEDTALPYLKMHVSETQAKQAAEFLNSPQAQTAVSNTFQKMRTGRADLVTPEDSALLKKFEATEFGAALVRFGRDLAVGRAVAAATQAYEP
jgi:hypothetical protein